MNSSLLKNGQCSLPQMRRSCCRGFSIVELFVVLGVILVVASLAIPAIKSARERGRHAADLGKIRSLGASVVLYSNDHRDVVPTPFSLSAAIASPNTPIYTPPGTPKIGGWWFTNPWAFHVLLTPRLSPIAVTAAGLQPPVQTRDESGTYPAFSDFVLADCLYTTPAYWDVRTQAGPSQWQSQRLTDIRSPSLKGMMRQSRVISDRKPGEMTDAFSPGVASTMMWGDTSATVEVQGNLTPGVPNFFRPPNPVPLPLWANGMPIAETRHGIYGRDR
jgi:type II secretory pathway pseudopilin PulG